MNLMPVLWLYSRYVGCKLALEHVVFETCRVEDLLVLKRKYTDTHAKYCCLTALGTCCCRKSYTEREADRRAWFYTAGDLKDKLSL